jgi:HlyD family secretion protein
VSIPVRLPDPPSTLDPATTQTNPVPEQRRLSLNPRAAITAVVFLAIIGLAIWYLVRPEPLLVQGEAESTRIDIAARVSGRLAEITMARGQNIAAGATLLVIDNPGLVAELGQAEAEETVADAELQHIKAYRGHDPPSSCCG